MVRTAQDYTAL